VQLCTAWYVCEY